MPAPAVRGGQVLIRTRASLVSAGTERMLVEFGRANLLEKARRQPDKVYMVLDKIRTDGLMPTIEAVRNKLDQPLALGYCNVGTVVEIGPGVAGLNVGDRVASNGKHAEFVSVPVNLCAKVPDSVSDEAAVFTVLGAVALQGVRLAAPTLGDAFVVTGLGLVGLLTVQLLRAHGCRVMGLDYSSERVELARRLGVEAEDLSLGIDPIDCAERFSRSRGVDGVLITATTTSSEPVHQAAVMCRKRGHIVLVGVTGLELSRADFYEKELTFQVSCSYGPGRYDPAYEEKGRDYPIGFVRWTEQRNFEAVLDMLTDGRVRTEPLVSHRFPIERAEEAYTLIASSSHALGILLEYSRDGAGAELSRTVSVAPAMPGSAGHATLAFVGAGNYANTVLMPAFRRTRARMKTVACSAGVSGVHVGRRHGFEQITTDSASIFADPDISVVVVATRHDSHARFVIEALRSGKHVFVEKPLALSREDVDAIERGASRSGAPLLMVGFNRRFAPHVVRSKAMLGELRQPKSFVMTVNAGMIPASHWTQDREAGGGRIAGEVCHFVDLLRFLAGAPVRDWHVAAFPGATGEPGDDKASITLSFVDGSIGAIHYLANGHRGFPKERLEVFCGGRILQLDNFRVLTGYGWPGFSRNRLWRQDKGQAACAAAFVQAVRVGGASPIPLTEILEVARLTLDLADVARR